MTSHRYEIKFVLDTISQHSFLDRIRENTKLIHAHPDRKVSSIYFDDIDRSSLSDNIIGLAQRKKYRIRWYGDFTGDTSLNLEKKCRDGRLGFKQVFTIDTLKIDLLNSKLNQFYPLISQFLEQSGESLEFSNKYLFPSLQVTYDRQYYEAGAGIRVTVDSNIMFSNPSTHKKISERYTYSYPKTVIEIKFTKKNKDKVSSLIRNLPFTPTRHSKYVVGCSVLEQVNYI